MSKKEEGRRRDGALKRLRGGKGSARLECHGARALTPQTSVEGNAGATRAWTQVVYALLIAVTGLFRLFSPRRLVYGHAHIHTEITAARFLFPLPPAVSLAAEFPYKNRRMRCSARTLLRHYWISTKTLPQLVPEYR